MTLDERIEKDLKELYNNGEISGAVDLNGLVEKEKEGLYWVENGTFGIITPQEDTVIKLLKSNSGLQKEQLTVQAQMTIDKLEPLLERLKISGHVVDEISFATRALPIYTGGKRGAKTVMVMLNPGKGVKDSNNDLLIELKKRSMFTMLAKLCRGSQLGSGNANLTKDIDNYNYFNAHYGHWDRNRYDSFDVKQAFFLRDWPGTGINLPKGLCANSSLEEKLAAKERVLDNKQQIELIPYSSSRFVGFNSSVIHKVFPYIDLFLEEIFSAERKYVIFCAKIFEEVFKAYNKYNQTSGKVTFVDVTKRGKPISRNVKISYTNKDGQPSQMSCYCTVIELAHGGKTMPAIIANTFPKQDLTNVYEVMAAYGYFCYECLQGMHGPYQPHSIKLP